MQDYPYIESRNGREMQRYDGETRLVIGCVPVHNKSFLLISSHKSRDLWGLPKGGWELDETNIEAARRETFEEAGVTGAIGPCISNVIYMNKACKPVKWDLYVMIFEKEYDWWPESDVRQRRWVSEEDLNNLSLSPLTQMHIPHILKYIREC